jgi:hypothetical protein
MVDVYGTKSNAVACPLCPNFREYISNLFAYYAREIEPDTIWVEDDFRLHNHLPLEWGGCFCDLHI